MKTVVQKTWISGVLAALAASLCCIAPLLAVFGGISGAATAFNWIEPYRPWLVGLTIMAFAFAWYQQLGGTRRNQEDCCVPAKRSFWQTKGFLLIVTLCATVLMAFPYYSSLFYKTPVKVVTAKNNLSRLKYVRLNIKGMGCADCTKHIDGTLAGVNGVTSAVTSFEKALTVVSYDPAKTTADSISHKIKEIGYQPTLVKSN
ncbi:mercuric transport protein MerTP [Mucilaginibacter sp. 14171R-50]|uniref:mercuric transport protein MerTP n=1 Tax=Mucilaginibacter sp. 14171R-50 TaxID=2703789 RepID=UPI00138D024C|nr:mercuric transport protein MerTP [Mucilaginibacter sp. 14171R-50]QHS55182.1 mercuric transport protein MerTP [Mucilaginibacter sp. 14171R-50]